MVRSRTFDRAVSADGVLRKLDDLHQLLAVARSLLLIGLVVSRDPIRHTEPDLCTRHEVGGALVELYNALLS